MDKSVEEICQDIESDGDIVDFAKDLILDQENYENSLSLFEKYIQAFISIQVTKNERYVQKFTVLVNKYISTAFRCDYETHISESYRIAIVRFTQKIFEVIKTFNVNGNEYFVFTNLNEIECCFLRMTKEDFVENFSDTLQSFIPKGAISTEHCHNLLP